MVKKGMFVGYNNEGVFIVESISYILLRGIFFILGKLLF